MNSNNIGDLTIRQILSSKVTKLSICVIVYMLIALALIALSWHFISQFIAAAIIMIAGGMSLAWSGINGNRWASARYSVSVEISSNAQSHLVRCICYALIGTIMGFVSQWINELRSNAETNLMIERAQIDAEQSARRNAASILAEAKVIREQNQLTLTALGAGNPIELLKSSRSKVEMTRGDQVRRAMQYIDENEQRAKEAEASDNGMRDRGHEIYRNQILQSGLVASIMQDIMTDIRQTIDIYANAIGISVLPPDKEVWPANLFQVEESLETPEDYIKDGGVVGNVRKWAFPDADGNSRAEWQLSIRCSRPATPESEFRMRLRFAVDRPPKTTGSLLVKVNRSQTNIVFQYEKDDLTGGISAVAETNIVWDGYLAQLHPLLEEIIKAQIMRIKYTPPIAVKIEDWLSTPEK